MTRRRNEHQREAPQQEQEREQEQPLSDDLPNRVFSTAFGMTIRPKPTKARETGESAQEDKTIYTIIKADLLIPGAGEPTKDAALVVESKLIVWVGLQSEIPSKYTGSSSSGHREYSIPYIMPGLWDCHVHFEGASTGSLDEEVDEMNNSSAMGPHPATAGARLAIGCWEALQRGYTSLRDLAGYGCELANAIDDGSIVGPNIYPAGACLSQTAGHGDIFSAPAGDVLLNSGVSTIHAGHFGTGMSMLVDGVDECRRAVRLQIRRGAKCIKLFATGGVLSESDNPLYAQFSEEELETIVKEANRQGLSVAAHVHGKLGILAAVNAGVATVEHCSFADDECINVIKEKGVVYVATRTIVALLLRGGGKGLTRKQWEKAQLCGTHHEKSYKMAIQAGLPIALGTDTPPGFNMAMELDFAVQAGMSNLEAIKAATANGPLTVGAKAPKTGQLKVGYEADILGLSKNPVDEVKVLQDKKTIGWVWKGGKLFKGPGIGPFGEGP